MFLNKGAQQLELPWLDGVTQARAPRRPPLCCYDLQIQNGRPRAPQRLDAHQWTCLDRQDEAKPIVNFAEQSEVESSDSFREKRLVYSDDLRNICDRRFREAGSLDREADVSRRIGQAQVLCNGRRNNRTDCAVVEAICRNDKQRAPEARARRGGLQQGTPPNLAAAHYRLPRASVRC
jgi:hypothetical protein